MLTSISLRFSTAGAPSEQPACDEDATLPEELAMETGDLTTGATPMDTYEELPAAGGLAEGDHLCLSFPVPAVSADPSLTALPPSAQLRTPCWPC